MSNNEYKLFLCDQETGNEGMLDRGTKEDMLKQLSNLSENGSDAWIITPSGDKILPE